MTGIYIHVPFCAVKCPYCDFYSCNFSLNKISQFKDALIRNIMVYPAGIKADTIYFGGGTPSLLPPEFITEIIRSISNHFDLHNPEITLEANPCTVNKGKLYEYRKSGVNRLSLGIQSASDDELKFLGRKHNYDKAKAAVEDAAEMGFENISCDMMIGLPNQTEESIDYTIKQFIALPIQHISSYILKIEQNTKFYHDSVSDIIPDDDTTANLYLFMTEQLNKAGFYQYEISNFALNGFESKHNLKYWECKEYIGFGPSAHSYFNGNRYAVTNDLEAFIKADKQNEFITDNNPGQQEEKIMLGLRLKKGICLDDFPERKSYILKKSYSLEKAGLLEIKDNYLNLTSKGFLVSNSIISSLI